MKIEVFSGSRADYGTAKAIADALGLKSISPAQDAHLFGTNLDLAIVIGDRFETLRATVELFIAGCAIGHCSGGDITEGSQDDSMRHAITKLSHLHFVTNEESARRVIQMGEEPWRVHNVGAPQIDSFETFPQTDYSYKFILVVWHPNTIDSIKNQAEVIALIEALENEGRRYVVVGPNQDAGHVFVRSRLQAWCRSRNHAYIENLERKAYLTLLKHCSCLVGNSSSGYYEAPYFGTPVVDIGDRQKGRLKTDNIYQCNNFDEVAYAIRVMSSKKFQPIAPYGSGDAAQKIATIISRIDDPQKLLRKKWHDLRIPVGTGNDGVDRQELRGGTSEVQTLVKSAGNGKAKWYHDPWI